MGGSFFAHIIAPLFRPVNTFSAPKSLAPARDYYRAHVYFCICKKNFLPAFSTKKGKRAFSFLYIRAFFVRVIRMRERKRQGKGKQGKGKEKGKGDKQKRAGNYQPAKMDGKGLSPPFPPKRQTLSRLFNVCPLFSRSGKCYLFSVDNIADCRGIVYAKKAPTKRANSMCRSTSPTQKSQKFPISPFFPHTLHPSAQKTTSVILTFPKSPNTPDHRGNSFERRKTAYSRGSEQPVLLSIYYI